MAIYRSAMGKKVDMSALEARNELTRAVGNMKVNARGDSIDSQGKIIKPVTQKVNERYSKTVGNRSAQPTKKPISQPKPTKPVITEEMTAEERELEDSSYEDLEYEKTLKK